MQKFDILSIDLKVFPVAGGCVEVARHSYALYMSLALHFARRDNYTLEMYQIEDMEPIQRKLYAAAQDCTPLPGII